MRQGAGRLPVVIGAAMMGLSALILILLNQTAHAATVSGGAGLALASLVAGHSPVLSGREKRVMARMFDGNLNFTFPAGKKITVQAQSVVCRASNVDITSHSCDLKFNNKTVALKGRAAHELFGTIAQAGVPPEGAAGSIFESLSHLVCTIDPNEIKQKGGGGAQCSFDPGPP